MAVEADAVSRGSWWPGGRRGAVALASAVLVVTVVGLLQVASRGSHLLCQAGMARRCRPSAAPGGRQVYVAANESLVDELSVFPGGRRLTTTSSSYTLGDEPESPIDGYTTTATFAVPAGTTADAIV